MENIIWYAVMIPCSAVFTCIGIHAWNRKTPMWFWSGTTVKAEEISDIPAYNHANGRMWFLFSLLLWFSTFIGIWSPAAALITLAASLLFGLPVLMVVYRRIYNKYKV